MAKKTLTGPGLEPETSGLTYQRSTHLSYPALWMVAVSFLSFVFLSFVSIQKLIDSILANRQPNDPTIPAWLTFSIPTRPQTVNNSQNLRALSLSAWPVVAKL